MTSSANQHRRRIPASSSTSRQVNSLALLILALIFVASNTSNHHHYASAHAPSTALFDALDADGDGQISPEDWDVSMTKLTTTLGIDTHEFDEMSAQHRNGGELGAMGRNEAAAHRDGLSGENLVPKKQLGGAFNPASAGSPSRKAGASGPDGKKKLSFTKAFTASVAMILATEIGDKTFFIAAVLSMRNDRAAVFGGAILALIVMTILR